MRLHNVLLTQAALADLARIAEHVAANSPARALSFIDELQDACLGLADMPGRFGLVPRHEKQGVRRRVHGPYLIFYRIAGDDVQVLHVLHGAMDFEPLLFPDG
jgi:plasmid stabilization system protein ParE